MFPLNTFGSFSRLWHGVAHAASPHHVTGLDWRVYVCVYVCVEAGLHRGGEAVAGRVGAGPARPCERKAQAVEVRPWEDAGRGRAGHPPRRLHRRAWVSTLKGVPTVN